MTLISGIATSSGRNNLHIAQMQYPSSQSPHQVSDPDSQCRGTCFSLISPVLLYQFLSLFCLPQRLGLLLTLLVAKTCDNVVTISFVIHFPKNELEKESNTRCELPSQGGEQMIGFSLCYAALIIDTHTTSMHSFPRRVETLPISTSYPSFIV